MCLEKYYFADGYDIEDVVVPEYNIFSSPQFTTQYEPLISIYLFIYKV